MAIKNQRCNATVSNAYQLVISDMAVKAAMNRLTSYKQAITYLYINNDKSSDSSLIHNSF